MTPYQVAVLLLLLSMPLGELQMKVHSTPSINRLRRFLSPDAHAKRCFRKSEHENSLCLLFALFLCHLPRFFTASHHFPCSRNALAAAVFTHWAKEAFNAHYRLSARAKVTSDVKRNVLMQNPSGRDSPSSSNIMPPIQLRLIRPCWTTRPCPRQ